jgi:hypothetical protein
MANLFEYFKKFSTESYKTKRVFKLWSLDGIDVLTETTSYTEFETELR